ncbi:MbeB family mobilization protein [Photobacterium indicum]|uniref:MbeB family mobilization protein n=1 Tax=Photobacterium indicum TaxID=81447 RepID=UPI003D0F3BE4
MSKISDLAATFEETSNKQACDTEQRLKKEFKQHEAFIIEALNLSKSRIDTAISAQSSNLSRLILPTWLWVIFSVMLVISVSWGVIWYQGVVIADNWQIIAKQNDRLDKLAKSNITTSTEEGNNYLVLPTSSEITDTYMSTSNHPVVVWTE